MAQVNKLDYIYAKLLQQAKEVSNEIITISDNELDSLNIDNYNHQIINLDNEDNFDKYEYSIDYEIYEDENNDIIFNFKNIITNNPYFDISNYDIYFSLDSLDSKYNINFGLNKINYLANYMSIYKNSYEIKYSLDIPLLIKLNNHTKYLLTKNEVSFNLLYDLSFYKPEIIDMQNGYSYINNDNKLIYMLNKLSYKYKNNIYVTNKDNIKCMLTSINDEITISKYINNEVNIFEKNNYYYIEIDLNQLINDNVNIISKNSFKRYLQLTIEYNIYGTLIIYSVDKLFSSYNEIYGVFDFIDGDYIYWPILNEVGCYYLKDYYSIEQYKEDKHLDEYSSITWDDYEEYLMNKICKQLNCQLNALTIKIYTLDTNYNKRDCQNNVHFPTLLKSINYNELKINFDIWDAHLAQNVHNNWCNYLNDEINCVIFISNKYDFTHHYITLINCNDIHMFELYNNEYNEWECCRIKDYYVFFNQLINNAESNILICKQQYGWDWMEHCQYRIYNDINAYTCIHNNTKDYVIVNILQRGYGDTLITQNDVINVIYKKYYIDEEGNEELIESTNEGEFNYEANSIIKPVDEFNIKFQQALIHMVKGDNWEIYYYDETIDKTIKYVIYIKDVGLSSEDLAVKQYKYQNYITLIDYTTFENNNYETDINNNEYVELDNGNLYLQIINKGSGNEHIKNNLIMRFIEYNLYTNEITARNDYYWSSPTIIIEENGHLINDNDRNSYFPYTEIPEAFNIILNYLYPARITSESDLISKVKVIVKSTLGHSYAQQNKIPYLYELTFQPMRS